MYINQKLGELHIKIVYYGPARSGKTTNLQFIHGHINPNSRGELVSLKTREDRTIFFDFLQLELGKINGLKPKFSLYTVPGQVYYEASRKLVLQGSDGVVFVADSQRDRLADNINDLKALEDYLKQLGTPIDSFPCVVQFNKQDLPDIIQPDDLKARMNINGYPCMGSSAIKGHGVFDTLKAVINLVIKQL